MTRKTWILVAVIAVAAVAAFMVNGHSKQAFATGDSVVIVEFGGSPGHGSGAHIGDGIILTAAHVLAKGGGDITVRDRHGVRSNATVLWSNKSRDIALIKMDDAVAAKKIPIAKIHCGLMDVGDYVEIVGSPINVEFISGYGRISGAPRKMGPVDSVYVINAAVAMGQSGGPLFHNGKIVGVVSMVMVASLPMADKDDNGDSVYAPSIVGYGYAVPSSDVCGLMESSA